MADKLSSVSLKAGKQSLSHFTELHFVARREVVTMTIQATPVAEVGEEQCLQGDEWQVRMSSHSPLPALQQHLPRRQGRQDYLPKYSGSLNSFLTPWCFGIVCNCLLLESQKNFSPYEISVPLMCNKILRFLKKKRKLKREDA